MEQNRVTDVGQYQPLTKRFAKALASAAIAGTLALGAWTFAQTSESIASGENRTISLYHVHTKESLTITYMQDGRYVPSAMKKINHLMRDWRRNEPIGIDPRTLDLMWELHADLGSQRPIHVVCGYRSPRTNAFLKKIGRKVARKSQHMNGKAIDFYFPDVPTQKIRNSALARKVGGVGYYRSSGGPTGFLHVDTGNVRYWGPGLNSSQMASAIREGKKVVGKRLTNKTMDTVPMQVAAEDDAAEKSGGLWGLVTGKRGKKQPAGLPTSPLDAYAVSDLAQYSADAAAVEGDEGYDESAPLDNAIVDTIPVNRPSPVSDPDMDGMAAMSQSAAVESLADGGTDTEATIGYILKPRLKPRDVMAMASLNRELAGGVSIEPANAGPESQIFKRKPSPVATAVAAISADESIIEENLVSNSAGKTSFADIRETTFEEQPLFEPEFPTTTASFGTADVSWWKSLWSSAQELQADDNVAATVKADLGDVMPRLPVLGSDGEGIIGYQSLQSAAGKGNLLVVNRDGKGNLAPMNLRLSQAASELEESQ